MKFGQMNNSKTEKEILDQCDVVCREISDAVGSQLETDNNLYQEDLYFWFPTVKRTLTLVRGYHTLIESGNYYTAIHLIRLVLDSGLRFASLWFVSDRRAFFRHINDGGEIRNYKDNQNQRLTDARLVERLGEYFPSNEEDAESPVKNLYKELCSIIHLNDRHIAMLKDQKQKSDPKMRIRPFNIGSDGDILREEEKIYAANYLYFALVIVERSCKSWETERASRPKTDEH